MTLGTASSITLSNILGIDNIPTTQNIVVAAQSGSNTIINVYNCSTRAQVGSTITLSSVSSVVGVCMVTSTKGFLISTAGVHYALDLTAGTATAYPTISVGVYNQFAPIPYQQWASNGTIAYFCCTNGAIAKVDPTAGTCTVSTPYWTGATGDQACGVINKTGTTNFIWTTIRGRIIETDSSLNVVRQYMIKQPQITPEYAGNVSVTSITQYGVFLAYYAGYLLVSTCSSQLILFDHDLGIELHRKSNNVMASQGDIGTPPLVHTGTQTTLTGTGGDSTVGMGIAIVEYDFIQTPIQQRGFFVGESGDGNLYPRNIGINIFSGTKIGWLCHNSVSTLWFFPITGERSLSLQTVSQTIASIPTQGEAFIINDLGAGLASLMFRTTIPAAGRNVPMTAGQNVLVTFVSGNGMNKTVSSGRKTT